jgi:rhodanese-related sulfurtransferase
MMVTQERLNSGELDVFTAEETKTMLDRGEAVLIDVRTPAEFAFERIRGALLVPMSDVDPAWLPAQAGKRIILHCASGVRSKHVAELILQAGHGPVAHMDMGMVGWKRAGLPYVATDPITGAPRDVALG